MKFDTLELDRAVGGVLMHNISDSGGHKVLAKGHRLSEQDIAKLRALGKTRVLVGMYEAGDIGENQASTRIAAAVLGANLTPTTAVSGRVNFLAAVRGVVRLETDVLDEINSLEGVAIATVPAHSVVPPNKIAATIKTIGLAVPESTLATIERIGAHKPGAIALAALRPLRVAVILSGTAEARNRIVQTFTPAIRGRIQDLGGSLLTEEFVAHEPGALTQAIERARGANAEVVILAGETSTMDVTDVTPTALRQAGGKVELYGAPVEPGNLLLLGYLGETPIIGAPGCIKSRDQNVVDLILPRLFAGERIGKKEIVALANGGLLL